MRNTNILPFIPNTQEQTDAFFSLGLKNKYIIKEETINTRNSSTRLYKNDIILFQFSDADSYKLGKVTDIEIDDELWVKIHDDISKEEYDMNMSSRHIIVLITIDPKELNIMGTFTNNNTNEICILMRIYKSESYTIYTLKYENNEESNWSENQFNLHWSRKS